MKKEILSLSAAVLLFAAAIAIKGASENISFILFLLAFLSSGMKVLLSAFKGIRRGNIFNENMLMIVAAIGAFCIREYPEAVFVVVFYRVGEIFEKYAVNKSRKSINEVMNICPEYVNLLIDGQINTVDPDEAQVGDIFVVPVGEKVPLDGVVIEGSSFIDTSALTGESVPRRIEENDSILSGCINKTSVIKVKVTKTFDNSTVSRILRMVETASEKKSTSEKFITRFARYYTPIVLVCAALLAFVPPMIFEGAYLSDFVYRALSFLVVSCPCALVISVPLAVFGGIGSAAKEGILVKGGNYLEVLSETENIVFDKTGTLTKGTFSVLAVDPSGMSEDELLEIAAYAENASVHPIAVSIRQTYGKETDISKIGSSAEIAGQGVKTVVGGKTVLAGNSKLMKSIGIDCSDKMDGTYVYVAVDNVFAGSILISDEIKNDVKQAVMLLKKSGIKRISMLTGDIKESAEKVAKQVGIDDVRSELMPDEKVFEFERIMAEAKGKTVYVGDGINDAPVLARADAGVAMGALGSDAAIEAADIVIMTDEISKIETAVRVAKKTMRIAKQNIIFSVAVKMGILVLCSMNILGMGIAVFGDVGVMILAVLNSFRVFKR